MCQYVPLISRTIEMKSALIIQELEYVLYSRITTFVGGTVDKCYSNR